MNLKIINSNFYFNLIIIFVVFILDRLSKLYVIYLDKINTSSEIFSSKFLNIYLIWNEGIAFGLLSFTTEEIYRLLFKDNKSIHLEKFIDFPNTYANEKLYQKWLQLIKIRNICNISIEEKRANKEIGSSLEADLNIHLDKKFEEITKNIDFSELCITSKAQISFKKNQETNAQTTKAKGTKCPVCWKISEVSCPRHP